jgi:hypothetical protein
MALTPVGQLSRCVRELAAAATDVKQRRGRRQGGAQPFQDVDHQEDAIGIRLRDVIGVDNMMWGSDYPRSQSTTSAS